jgi:hypothetical protein
MPGPAEMLATAPLLAGKREVRLRTISGAPFV